MLGQWWSPYKITYTFAQCTWLLGNLMQLREAIWPPDPEGKSSYVDPKIVVKGGEYKAYTENIGTVIGTLERWLQKTGKDGAMAYLRFSLECSYSEISKMFGVSKDEAYAGAIRAIKHCVAMGEKLPKR